MIGGKSALAYQRNLDKATANGDVRERRELLKAGIEEMTLYPDDLRVDIKYRISPFVADTLVAGARYVSIHNKLKAWLMANLSLSSIGRHLLAA